jgi:hypothetical protein
MYTMACGGEDEVALVRGDEGGVFVTFGVEDGSQVIRRLMDAVHPPGSVEVPTAVPFLADRREKEGSGFGDRKEPVVVELVHNRIYRPGLRPTLTLPLHIPDVLLSRLRPRLQRTLG